MTMTIRGGDQHKAEGVAREIIDRLTVLDIGWIVTEDMGLEAEQRLCSAIDENYPKDEQRMNQLAQEIDSEPCNEYMTLASTVSSVRQQAQFLLGYMTARRVLGIDETMKNRGRSMPVRAKKKRARRRGEGVIQGGKM